VIPRLRFYRTAGLAALSYLAAEQAPHVRHVNFYGLHRITADRVLREIQLHPGDPLPGSRGELEDRIAKIPGVFAARVEGVCCEGAEADLFIGIEERGGPHVALRSAPVGEAALPEELAEAYDGFVTAVKRAGSIRSSPETRAAEQQFTEFAGAHAGELQEVVRNAADVEQRAIAAGILRFAPRKQSAVDDLQYALQDPDETVRENALGSLRVFALLSVKQPRLNLRVEPTWLVELLNSVVLGDRMQAVDLLITLTDGGDRAVLDQIRSRGLLALVEMARWENLRYALPAFVLVGRLAGLADEETQSEWKRGAREPVIEKALGGATRKR
jgi:hypothetical protein